MDVEGQGAALCQLAWIGGEGGIDAVVVVKGLVAYFKALEHPVLVGDVRGELGGAHGVCEALVGHVQLPAACGLDADGAACLCGNGNGPWQGGGKLFKGVLGGQGGVHFYRIEPGACGDHIGGGVVVDIEEIHLVADLGGLACGLVGEACYGHLIIAVVAAGGGVVVCGLCKPDAAACSGLQHTIGDGAVVALAALQVRHGDGDGRGIGDGELGGIKVQAPARDGGGQQLRRHIAGAGEGIGGVGHYAAAQRALVPADGDGAAVAEAYGGVAGGYEGIAVAEGAEALAGEGIALVHPARDGAHRGIAPGQYVMGAAVALLPELVAHVVGLGVVADVVVELKVSVQALILQLLDASQVACEPWNAHKVAVEVGHGLHAEHGVVGEDALGIGGLCGGRGGIIGAAVAVDVGAPRISCGGVFLCDLLLGPVELCEGVQVIDHLCCGLGPDSDCCFLSCPFWQGGAEGEHTGTGCQCRQELVLFHFSSSCSDRFTIMSEFIIAHRSDKCQQKRPLRFAGALMWSGLRGSNSLPPPWQGGALPDELNPHYWCFRTESNHRHGDFQSPALPTELQKRFGDRNGTRTHDLQRDRLAF